MTQHLGHVLDKGFTRELQAGNIDRDLDWVRRNRLPGGGFCTRKLHNVGAQRDNQSALFCNGNELLGRNHAQGWVSPACQGFEPQQPA